MLDAVENSMEMERIQKEIDRLQDNNTSTETRKDDTQEKFTCNSKDRAVEELARLMNMDPGKYLAFLNEHNGWYKEIKGVNTKIKKGSSVPVPATTKEQLKSGYGPLPQHSEDRTKRAKTLLGGVQQRKTSTMKEAEASKGQRRRSPRTRSKKAEQTLQVAHAIQQEANTAWHEETTSLRTQPRLGHATANAMQAEANTTPARTSAKHIPDPKSWDQARKYPFASDWKAGELKEWTGLWRKGCFEEHEWTHDKKMHRLLWTYKRKSDGTFKARLCMDGRKQDPSTYDNIRSPKMRLTSMRILLALACQRGWAEYTDDATQAFLNAPRPKDKPICVYYPDGFRKKNKVLLLKKMLYGLHGAPLGWFKEVRKHLVEEQGLTQSKVDECCFYGNRVHAVVHVDDFLITGKEQDTARVRTTLHKKFKMTRGLASEYYGLEIKQDTRKGTTAISCKKYIEKTMAKLKIATRQQRTPMEAELTLPRLQGPCKTRNYTNITVV